MRVVLNKINRLNDFLALINDVKEFQSKNIRINYKAKKKYLKLSEIIGREIKKQIPNFEMFFKKLDIDFEKFVAFHKIDLNSNLENHLLTIKKDKIRFHRIQFTNYKEKIDKTDEIKDFMKSLILKNVLFKVVKPLPKSVFNLPPNDNLKYFIVERR